MAIFFRLLILLSLVLTGVSWWQMETLGILFLPFIGIPVFLYAAFAAEFLELKNVMVRVAMTLVGVLAIGYALLVTLTGTESSHVELGNYYITPTSTRIVSALATTVFIFGQAGLFYLSLQKIKKRKI